MPRVFNQKIKILYLMRVFLEQTDEEHPMSVKELITYLNNLGISAERKTVYDDIETLRNFGMDILNRREKPAGFYLASREFELPELKLLVDAVQSSRFITSRKSRQLIGKLESLASVYEARQLRRQVFVENRIRTMNESVYYSIDEIQRALNEDRQISFQYCEWTVEKELRLKKNGERYLVSPWGLVWQNENYYLVAYDEKCEKVKHYRVDKILQIQIENQPRDGKEIFKNYDTGELTSRTFGMFGGREETICLEAHNRLVGVVLDRFGRDIMIHRKDSEHFKTLIRVNVSGQFFGWIASLGPDAVIASPEEVREEYREFLEKSLSNYK
ncbi:WYL domain-containing protein [Blautia sp. CLA-JM-H16]|uniref:WYL domain-containing protein n=1 Tax=Blautia aquisgranensis TaxID=3133153 RepID=A0ABV1BFR7_9FIRM